MEHAVLCTALSALTKGPRHSISNAFGVVPNVPGLYAVSGDRQAITDLAIGDIDQPLYVGKAERSLVGRDLHTHFATGKTGSSTLRRALAALLREVLDLRAVPRNLARPDGSANYALEAGGEQRLTDWMHAHLRLAVWERPEAEVLKEVENAVLAELMPPLNLANLGKNGNRRLKAARAMMTAESRAWSSK